MANYLPLTDCYSQSRVIGDGGVGGLAGTSEGAVIKACYASGAVDGITDVGGLVGVVKDPFWPSLAGSIEDSFWDVWQSDQFVSAGGLGQTTAQMKQKVTFVNWDFEQVWDIVEGQTYPFLRSPDSE